jgi:hypothetical protein
MPLICQDFVLRYAEVGLGDVYTSVYETYFGKLKSPIALRFFRRFPHYVGQFITTSPQINLFLVAAATPFNVRTSLLLAEHHVNGALWALAKLEP